MDLRGLRQYRKLHSRLTSKAQLQLLLLSVVSGFLFNASLYGVKGLFRRLLMVHGAVERLFQSAAV